MRILIADEHRLMRDGLRALLEREELEVVGDAANGQQAIELAHQLEPDLVVMDLSMPGLNGLEATKRLVGELPHVKVLGLSMNPERRHVLAMLAAGASGYVSKCSASDELVGAIRAIAAGNEYVSPAVVGVELDRLAEVRAEPAAALPKGATPAPFGAVKPLSVREREVLQLLAEGKSSKEMAQQLHVAVATIETHRRQIMDRLDLHSVAQLTKYAIREGLTALE